jgi:hypothetical protein
MLRASATRCIWPPDNATTGLSAYSDRPTSSSASSDLKAGVAARKFSVLERIDHVLPHRHMRPHRIGLKHHAELAQRGGTRMPRSGDETTLPAMLISPEVGCSSPATQRSVVVLPQPEGPSRTTISPAGTQN